MNGVVVQQPLAGIVITQPVHTMDGWSYEDCGSFTVVLAIISLRLCVGLSTDPVQIDSISVTPDPPQPGKDLTVKVKATVVENIVVRARECCDNSFFSKFTPLNLGRSLCRCQCEIGTG